MCVYVHIVLYCVCSYVYIALHVCMYYSVFHVYFRMSYIVCVIHLISMASGYVFMYYAYSTSKVNGYNMFKTTTHHFGIKSRSCEIIQNMMSLLEAPLLYL